MGTHNEQQAATNEQFEQKAQELISMMFTLCEEYVGAVDCTQNPHTRALSASALTVQEAVRTFLAVKHSL